MVVVRVVLPAALVLAGLVLLVVGDETWRAAGIALIGVALLVWMWNLLLRLSMVSQRDRDREEEARRYFERHGRWPRDRS